MTTSSITHHPKIVAIGVGSHIFGSTLLRDVFSTPELFGSELCLVDEAVDALETSRRLAEQFNRITGASIELMATIDRNDALPGADFVVVAVARQRDVAWQADHRLALQHGFASVLSENGGPGGLSHTLRSVPLALEIVADVERLAPDALVLQYTNPENRIAHAIAAETNVCSVGLCHGVAETKFWAGELLGRPVQLDVGGVNHFNWVLGVRSVDRSEDLMPAFTAAVQSLPDDVFPLSRRLLRHYGYFPTTTDNHVGEYIPWAASVIGTAGYDMARFALRRETLTSRLNRASDDLDVARDLLTEPTHEMKVENSAATLIADIVLKRTTTRHRSSFPTTD